MCVTTQDIGNMAEEDPDQGLNPGGFFDEPEGYYPSTPPPTTQSHSLLSGRSLTLHLVGHSPTEAHHLWNGARVVADLFDADPSVVAGRSVLELGAGAGLPSLVAALLGARTVVMTDFPDADLVENMWRNVSEAGLTPLQDGGNIVVEGYVWGADSAPLLSHLPADDDGAAGNEKPKFDVLILADLLFRHAEHGKLVDTIEATLRRSRDSKAFVVFTSYRPWLQHKDLAFFDVAKERGFEVEKVFERKMDKPLFENDPGDEEILKTVSGYNITWPAEKCEED